MDHSSTLELIATLVGRALGRRAISATPGHRDWGRFEDAFSSHLPNMSVGAIASLEGEFLNAFRDEYFSRRQQSAA